MEFLTLSLFATDGRESPNFYCICVPVTAKDFLINFRLRFSHLNTTRTFLLVHCKYTHLCHSVIEALRIHFHSLYFINN